MLFLEPSTSVTAMGFRHPSPQPPGITPIFLAEDMEAHTCQRGWDLPEVT